MSTEEVPARLFACVPKPKLRPRRIEEIEQDEQALWALRQLADRPQEQRHVPTIGLWQRLYIWPIAGYVARHGWPTDFGITPEELLGLMQNFNTTRL